MPAPIPPASVVHLNSLLRGGGTDDQCVKLAHGLRALGHSVWLAGPDGREFANVARNLGVPFHATPPEGLLKLRFILSAARLIRRQHIQIVHGHHGRDLWPTVLAARLSGQRSRIVLTRHLAKSPGSWASAMPSSPCPSLWPRCCAKAPTSPTHPSPNAAPARP